MESSLPRPHQPPSRINLVARHELTNRLSQSGKQRHKRRLRHPNDHRTNEHRDGDPNLVPILAHHRSSRGLLRSPRDQQNARNGTLESTRRAEQRRRLITWFQWQWRQ